MHAESELILDARERPRAKPVRHDPIIITIHDGTDPKDRPPALSVATNPGAAPILTYQTDTQAQSLALNPFITETTSQQGADRLYIALTVVFRISRQFMRSISRDLVMLKT